MKTVGLFSILTLATTLAATAQQSPPPSPEVEKIVATEAPPAKLSSQVSQQLTDKLPKYTPPPPAAPVQAEPAMAPNPDVLQLPKVTVKQRKRPRLTDEVMMTTKAFNEKLAKERLSSLDRNVLNKFTLPAWFGGVSAEQRARDDYEREKRADLANEVFGLAKIAEQTDPEQAKALRDAISRP
jgi:hypothetical protein